MTFQLDGLFSSMSAECSFDDIASIDNTDGVLFEVMADDVRVWASSEMTVRRNGPRCDNKTLDVTGSADRSSTGQLDLTGVQQLTLVLTCLGKDDGVDVVTRHKCMCCVLGVANSGCPSVLGACAQ